MQALPHHYAVTATVSPGSHIDLTTAGVPSLPSDAPPEFDGPDGFWSPESMLVGAVADCVAITFRGVARASKLAWHAMTCDVVGTLDKVDGVTKFTEVRIRARVTLEDAADQPLAERVLDKAKRSCLITNSMTAAVSLDAAFEIRRIVAHERSA
jgi:organic hydroperoxide reductase OsmC/OhrA